MVGSAAAMPLDHGADRTGRGAEPRSVGDDDDAEMRCALPLVFSFH
uniref:Uncharacterized protein n=1 Tax=Arundo donax TaxID=35708 RepID=A0A0A9FTV4_ARUDO